MYVFFAVPPQWIVQSLSLHALIPTKHKVDSHSSHPDDIIRVITQTLQSPFVNHRKH